MGAARDKVEAMCKANSMESEWDKINADVRVDLVCMGMLGVVLAYEILLLIGKLFYHFRALPVTFTVIIIMAAIGSFLIIYNNNRGGSNGTR